MSKLTSLSEVVSFNADFRNAINIYLSLNDSEKVMSYIPTKSSVNILEMYLNSIKNNKNNASVLIGPYGKGKSHLLLLLLAIASLERNEENSKLMEALEDKIGRADKSNINATKLIKDVWAKGKFLPVIIMSSYNNLNQSFMMALNDALKREGLSEITPDTYYSVAYERINDWECNYQDTFAKFKKALKRYSKNVQEMSIGLKQCDKSCLDVFCEIYPELTAGSIFNPMAQLEILPLYKSVCEKLCTEYGYSGIYILFDEFSKFIESQDKQLSGNNMKLLQDMCELASDSKNEQIFITMVAHKSIKEYSKYLSDDTINAFTGIEGRLVENYFITSSKNNYELIKHAIVKKDGFNDKRIKTYISNEVVEKYYKMPYFNGLFDKKDFKEIVVEGCYPLNAISAYLLLNISEKVAQNERTLFTFISKDEPFSMAHYVNEHVKENSWVIGADLIYDYFSGLFKKDLNNEYVHNEWLNAEYALSRCKTDNEKKLVKALAVILIVNKPDEIPALDNYILSAANIEDIEVLDTLCERGIIYKKASTNCYLFKTRAGSDLRKEIKNRKLLNTLVNVAKVFESVSENEYIYPVAYNNKYKMTRYFRHCYMDADEFVSIKDITVLFSEYGFSDGYLISLFSAEKESLDEVVEKKVNEFKLDNLIIEYSSVPYKCYKQIQEFQILSEIINDTAFLHENEIVVKEIPVLEDDLREVIISNLNEMYVDKNRSKFAYYKNGECVQVKSTRTHVVNSVCMNVFDKTPIINNEMINRRFIGTAQTKKTRKVIIENILNNSDNESFYSGNGQEASIYRSMFIVTGIKKGNESPELKNVLKIINDFIDGCVDKKSSMANLVDMLLEKPHAIRNGIIPIYLAYVLSRRNEDIVVYFNSMEIELNADRIVGMCENPEDFSVFVSKKEADKELYLTELQKLFSIPENRITKDNRISITAEYIKKWYRALPQISRNMVNPAGYEVVTKQLKVIKKARKILQTIECNPYEFLFNDLVELFDKKDLNTALVGIKDIKYCYDNYYQWSIDKACEVIIKTIDNRSKKDIYHTLKEWYETQNDMAKQGLFNGRITNFMTCIENINTFDESEITKKIVKAVSDVYIEDWNDSSLAEFKDSLVAILQEISKIKDEEKVYSKKNKLSFIGVNNNIVERYYEPVGEEKGAVFRNIIEDTIEQFEDELSVNDQVAIMLEMIEKMMK